MGQQLPGDVDTLRLPDEPAHLIEEQYAADGPLHQFPHRLGRGALDVLDTLAQTKK